MSGSLLEAAPPLVPALFYLNDPWISLHSSGNGAGGAGSGVDPAQDPLELRLSWIRIQKWSYPQQL